MTDITVKIGGKQGPTGITDDVAERLHNGNLSSFIAIVEIHAEETRERIRDGKETVILSIGNFEPVIDDAKTEAHVREIQRALYGSRRLRTDGPMLPEDSNSSDVEPTVEEVVANNPGVIPPRLRRHHHRRVRRLRPHRDRHPPHPRHPAPRPRAHPRRRGAPRRRPGAPGPRRRRHRRHLLRPLPLDPPTGLQGCGRVNTDVTGEGRPTTPNPSTAEAAPAHQATPLQPTQHEETPTA